MRVAINKATVEVGKSKKYLDISDGAGNRPFGDGRYVGGIHRNTFERNDESQEADCLDVKFAFFELDI